MPERDSKGGMSVLLRDKTAHKMAASTKKKAKQVSEKIKDVNYLNVKHKQECIPAGCVLPASVAISEGVC